MKKNSIFKLFTIALSIVMLFGSLSLVAQIGHPVNAQTPVVPSPTPDEKGYIRYTVQDGDFACEIIAQRFGTTPAEIIRLNNLDENCSIFIGRTIIIGYVDPAAVPATATPAPAEATPVPPEQPAQTAQPEQPVATAQPEQPAEPVEPTATAVLDVGKICIVLFHDKDGNGMRIAGEGFLYGGEVSINDRTGTVSRVGTTVAGDPETTNPMCFEQLPPGEYNISIAVPDGFNNTTATKHTISIVAGETMTIDFGAQEATPESIAKPAETGSRSPLLFILGGVILLSGLGLLFYMLRSRRS